MKRDLLITIDQSRRPNLSLTFPCTLAMIRKVATTIGPGQPAFSDQDGWPGI
jgi:hypothetical protein